MVEKKPGNGHVSSISPDSVKVAFLMAQLKDQMSDPKKLRRNDSGNLTRPPRTSRSASTCNRFNDSKCSFGDACRFSHACSKCGGSHPAKNCRKPLAIQ